MRKNSFLTFLKEKSFIIVLALLLISAGTMVALFQVGRGAPKEQNQVARQETTETKNPAVKQNGTQEKQTTVPKSSVIQKNSVSSKKTDTKEKKKKEEAKAPMNPELEDQYMESAEMAEASAGDVVAEEFSQADLLSLQRPVEGETILAFSMDHSIYFPTLAQYQYNPAMIIGAAEGTPVVCAASGTVTDVGKSNEYGHYVTMDIGDGFEITYGQLFEVTAEIGEELEAGEQLALVAYPTRSYVEEGENLYLRLTKDGVSVDPEVYLED